MLQLALANLKSHSRRFIAVSLAVMIGTAFLAATLMVNSSTTASLQRSIGEAYETADLVATPDWINAGEEGVGTLGGKALKAVADVPGVAAVHGLAQAGVRVKAGSDVYNASAAEYAADESLRTVKLDAGVLPTAGDQIVVDSRYASEFGISIGDAVVLQSQTPDGKDLNINVSVVGLSAPSNNPTMGAGMVLTTNHSLLERLSGGEPEYSGVLIRTDGSNTTEIKADVNAALKASGVSPTEVLTSQERIIADVASMSGGEDQLTMVLLVFALVAFVVTGLVVMNTFSVLIAQRTRELALLRTLGAVRSQIRRSVLVEALIIGLLASALGALLATGVMATLIAILAATVEGASFAVLSVSPIAVIVGIGAGTLMTVIAAWMPARHAMVVAPLAALRPADDASLKNKAGMVRIVFGFVLLLVGGGLLAMGAVKNDLLIAFGGGLLSFPGVLLLCSLFLPKSVSAVGALFRGTGVPARLASLNAVRNPGRTTATATALLIGVTLVSMMMVGAQSAKSSLNGTLAENYLVDLTVGGNSPEDPFSTADTDKARAIDGVQDVAILSPVAQSGGGQTVYAADATELTSVLNDGSRIPGPGEVLVA
ncbi:MAG: ABC transporter permease, partial [Aquihabitans sp.]